MTGEEAISLLFNAYKYEVQKGGRGCGKTAMRTAMLMGANAISEIQKGVLLSEEEYNELLEYKQMYEDLCK